MVEHNLAKVGVASSSLVSRSSLYGGEGAAIEEAFPLFIVIDAIRRVWAGWQSGYAAACKAVYAGSIPTPASISFKSQPLGEIVPSVVIVEPGQRTPGRELTLPIL